MEINLEMIVSVRKEEDPGTNDDVVIVEVRRHAASLLASISHARATEFHIRESLKQEIPL